MQESLLLSPSFRWCDAHPSCVPLGWENDSFSPFKRKGGRLRHVDGVFGVFGVFAVRGMMFKLRGSQIKPESVAVTFPSPKSPKGCSLSRNESPLQSVGPVLCWGSQGEAKPGDPAGTAPLGDCQSRLRPWWAWMSPETLCCGRYMVCSLLLAMANIILTAIYVKKFLCPIIIIQNR